MSDKDFNEELLERTQKKMTKARAGLVLDQPFFGALALRLKPTPSAMNDTGWTDGTSIGYNPAWIDDMPLDKTKGFIAHEVMHLALGHQARRQNRDSQKWNAAGDFAINQTLIDAGFELPDDGLINSGYADKSAEEIYTLLPDSGQGGGGQDPGGCGAVVDAPGPTPDTKSNQQELKQSETDWKIAATQAAQSAKTMGNLPGAIKDMIKELLEPKVDWRDILREFIERAAKNDYTFSIPNRRYLSQGIILPSLNSKELGTACIAIDTSGSVSKDELKQFASEVNSILEEYQDITIKVIYCDTQVAHTETFHSTDMPVGLSMHGGGGTDFRPPFKWVEENIDGKPTCMIYFTDMECNSFPPDPEYPVIWIQTETPYSNHFAEAPFGEVITMDMKGDPNSRRNTI